MSIQLLFCECLCVHCSQLEHDAWLARERVAQAEFQKKREREETILREREEREVCVCEGVCEGRRGDLCVVYKGKSEGGNV